MTNAVERLWQALATGDSHRAATELHDHVVLERPHTGERFEGSNAYLTAHAGPPKGRSIEVRRVITEGRSIATEVLVATEDASWVVASFYTVQDGRILHAVEYWVPTT